MMILKKIQKTIQDYRLFDKKDKILLAYSGGVDSTGLLSLLLELRRDWSFKLFLAHFNHKLRQKAEEDEQFVRQTAQKHSLPLFVGSGDVRSYAKVRKLGIEESGRQLRYDFLQKVSLELGGTKIATGHTMTDQAETFLMRLMRGSGPRGLAGIYPVVEGTIIRPLLEIEREEIEACLKEKGIRFCIDESNYDRRYLRNRIRMDLIPYIKENFEPRIVPHLSTLASIIRDEDDLLEKITQEKAERVIIKKSREVFLELKSLFVLPRAIRRRVVRNFISEIQGDLRTVSFADIQSVLSLGEEKEFPLKKDYVLRRRKGLISLKKESLSQPQYEYHWKGEGTLEVKEIQLKIEGERVKRDDSLDLHYDDNTRVFLDLDKLCFPLLVRNRREGDRYHPLGAPGKKKLKEIMRAKGIPPSERGKHPIFLSGGEIVWVLGLSVAEKYKVREDTRNVFLIKKL